MSKYYFIIFVLLSLNISSQTIYTGFIDKYPIEFVLDARSSLIEATYTYTDYDEPISLKGELKKSKLVLFEKDKNRVKAILSFENFKKNQEKLIGIWKNLKDEKQLKISLQKKYNIEVGDNIEWNNIDMLQPLTIANKYFKISLKKERDSYYPSVKSIKIFEKKTDKLLQILDLDCQLWGLNNVSVEDYNFDGFADFSVFESSYAGPNTSSIYYLFDKKTGKFFESGFSGISLEFNHNKKIVTETNQCCAGTIVTKIEYKVINNSMIPLNRHCYKWNEKKQKLIEAKWKECQ